MAKKIINAEVRLSETKGDFSRMLKKFTKKVKKSKILESFRDRRFFEKPSAKRRKAKLRNQRKNRS